MSGVSPSWARASRTVSSTKGVALWGSNTVIRSKSAAPLNGAGRRGPSSVKVTGSPIASRGTSRSEKRMAASNPKRLIGCSVTCAASVGVLHRSRKETLARTSRYSGR
jgi:hypothetical protein